MDNTILAWGYDPETLELIGPVAADRDIVTGSVLVPQFGTTQEPPKPLDNHVTIYNNGKWEQVVDLRGVVYWLPDGTKHEIKSFLETIPETSLSEEPDLRTLLEMKNDAIEAIKSRHAQALKKLSGNHTPEEECTWGVKTAACLAHKQGTASASQTEMLTLEATDTGQSLEELVAEITLNDENYQKLIGTAAGFKRKSIAAIKACTRKSQVTSVLDDIADKADRKEAEFGS